MADLNAWTDRQKARTLREVRAEVGVLRAAAAGRGAEERGQRRMARRIESLLDAHIAILEGTRREALERALEVR